MSLLEGLERRPRLPCMRLCHHVELWLKQVFNALTQHMLNLITKDQLQHADSAKRARTQLFCVRSRRPEKPCVLIHMCSASIPSFTHQSIPVASLSCRASFTYARDLDAMLGLAARDTVA